MNQATKIFIKKKFKDYYRKRYINYPPNIEQREFGMGNFEKKIEYRHRAFKNGRDLNLYLRTDAPLYISYSAAYYEFPANQPIIRKVWLGSDLVFDLDMDMKMLDLRKLDMVKDEASHLINFLIEDFGIPSDKIEVKFSGSKGYHITVYDKAIQKLGKQDRREIADYISFSNGRLVEGSTWTKRIKEEFIRILNEKDIAALERLEGVGKKTADYLIKNKERITGQIERGSWEGIPGFRESSFMGIGKGLGIKIPDEDNMVTIDIHRLIRLQDTIHGGTGLVAKCLKEVGDLDGFNPLTEALAFDDSPTEISTTLDIPGFEIGGGSFKKIKKDEEIELPLYAAIYLMLKDMAEVAQVVRDDDI